MSKLRKKPVTKDGIWRINAESTQIHSFGLLDVDVWTLRRFRKVQEEKNTYIYISIKYINN